MNDLHYDQESKPLFQKSLQIGVESPENVEIEGKISSIAIKKLNKWKNALYIFLCIATGGLMYLAALWFIKFKIWITLSDSELNEANRIIIYGADNTIEIQKLKDQTRDGVKIKVFFYRLFKYIYSAEKNNFVPTEFKTDNLTYNDIHKRYGQGLTSHQYQDNYCYFGDNSTNIPMPGLFKLLMDEVLSPFYIFQLFSVIIWCFDEYEVYSGIIVFLSAISITTTLYETRQTTQKLKSMAEFKSQVYVYRDHNLDNKLKIDAVELVPGDIIEVPEGENMPCDAILLNGTCIMNEAMLTGESIPVTKNALPYNETLYSADDKNYTLFAGTQCIQARFFNGRTVLALVVRTGFTTVKGELIRTMLFPKQSNFKFYYDSFMFIGILAFMAVIGFLIDLPFFLMSDDSSSRILIIKCCEIVTVTVPPALPTCMAVGINVAIIDLKEHGIFCISPNKINEAGKINVMCFDKTGTLTEDGLDVLGVRTAMYDKNKKKLSFGKLAADLKTLNEVPEEKEQDLQEYIQHELSYKPPGKKSCFEATNSLPSEIMAEIMASCHSLTTIVDKETQKEKMIGDPLDYKMFQACGWELEENLNQQYDSLVIAVLRPPKNIGQKAELFIEENNNSPINTNQDEVAIVRRFEFSSKLQRMSVIVKKLNDTKNIFKMHLKGSPEKVREMCVPESVPDNFYQVLSKYTEEGKRVLAVGTKVLSQGYREIMAANQEDLEKKNFIFIGFLIMENKLKPVTTKIINDLHKANIRTVMVTGDNVLTAISVARQCEMVKPSQRIFLGDLSEQKGPDGKYYIDWKDFEYSSAKLNEDTLEPEEEQESTLDVAVSKPRPSARMSGPHKINLEQIVEEKPKGLDMGVMDLDPPFYSLDSAEDYVIAITGKAFSLIMDEINEHNSEKHVKLMKILLKKAVIFARMHPDEKALMIKNMQVYRRSMVGMCGDGANDCGALKTANVGISLSEAEASVAAPFTSKVTDISCVVTLLRYGRAALATSFQCFKYMALYSVIQFTTLTIVYAFQIDLSNADYYYIDIVIILPISFTMAFSGAYKKLTVYQPTGRLISVPILTSVIGQAVIQILCQAAIVVILFHEPWYADNKCQEKMSANEDPCIENCSLFLVSIFQYVVVSLAFMVGKPFRKPFYTNFWFTFCLVFLTIMNLILLFNPFNWQWLYPNINGDRAEDPITMILSRKIKEFDFQYVLFVLIVINTICTMVWERVIVKHVSLKWKEYKKQRKALEKKDE